MENGFKGSKLEAGEPIRGLLQQSKGVIKKTEVAGEEKRAV